MTAAYAHNEEYVSNLMQRVPARRWGLPEDMAGAVVYLASPASGFVTGTTLIVDGGLVGK
jgi:NAD(P)-dependent dehydrogenase (short-subunit alcohol dehydrogenase family)